MPGRLYLSLSGRSRRVKDHRESPSPVVGIYLCNIDVCRRDVRNFVCNNLSRQSCAGTGQAIAQCHRLTVQGEAPNPVYACQGIVSLKREACLRCKPRNASSDRDRIIIGGELDLGVENSCPTPVVQPHCAGPYSLLDWRRDAGPVLRRRRGIGSGKQVIESSSKSGVRVAVEVDQHLPLVLDFAFANTGPVEVERLRKVSELEGNGQDPPFRHRSGDTNDINMWGRHIRYFICRGITRRNQRRGTASVGLLRGDRNRP